MIKSLQIVFIFSLILFNCKSDEDNVPDISVDSITPEFLKLFNTSEDFSYSINGDYITGNLMYQRNHGKNKRDYTVIIEWNVIRGRFIKASSASTASANNSSSNNNSSSSNSTATTMKGFQYRQIFSLSA